MKRGVQTICTEHGMVKAWDVCWNCDGKGRYPHPDPPEGEGDICDICQGKGFYEYCPACEAVMHERSGHPGIPQHIHRKADPTLWYKPCVICGEIVP